MMTAPTHPTQRGGQIRLLCMLPAAIFFVAFWLLPIAVLVALPAEKGWDTYFLILTNGRYLQSLLNTLGLSLVTTLVTLILGASVGIYLARKRFTGRQVLISLLTAPLAFPGVIVGFFVILIGGRQGPFAALMQDLGLGRVTFAYGMIGLFLAYLYFSLPRAVASYTAAAESMDPQLEEAARVLGASRWQITRDAWWPQLLPTTVACGAIVFATAMGAFGTAFTLSSQVEVVPITIYNEFTNYANFAVAASLSIALGLVTWGVLFASRVLSRDSSAA
jgi:ABC-type sulfate transport system, permease component